MGTSVLIVEMTTEEARTCVDSVVTHLESVRALLYELYSRKGWKALGYTSYSGMVTQEFGKSKSFASRQLAAANMESRNELPVGTLSEGTLRRVRDMLPDEAHQDEAMMGSLSDTEILRAAKEMYIKHNGSAITYDSLIAGEIGLNDAYSIVEIYDAARYDMKGYIALCRDPALAIALLELPNSHTLQEIKATACIPASDAPQIPLYEATVRDLRHYLMRASHEHRQAGVVVRQEAWEEGVTRLINYCHALQSRAHHPELTEILCDIRANFPRNFASGTRSQT